MNITSKGQVTIPLAIRKTYNLEPDTEVEFVEENGRVWIRRMERKPESSRFGRFRGSADIAMSTDDILALTRQDPPGSGAGASANDTPDAADNAL